MENNGSGGGTGIQTDTLCCFVVIAVLIYIIIQQQITLHEIEESKTELINTIETSCAKRIYVGPDGTMYKPSEFMLTPKDGDEEG